MGKAARVPFGNRDLLEAPITLLLIEDDADEVLLLTGAMEDAGATDISVLHAGDLGSALGTLEARAVDAVLLDLSLPDSRGVDGVDSLVPVAGEAPVIVCTGLNDQDVAQEAIRRGAQDYLVKNPKLYGAVPRILRFAVERSRLVHSANRRVEQARKYTELLLTKVISVADAGLGIIVRKGQFSLVNPGLAELSGCNAPDLVGRDWTAILPDDVRDKAMAAYLDSLVGEPDFSRDNMKLQRLDGSIIDVSMRSVLLNLGDSNSGRVLSFSDRSGALSADLVGASLAGIASAANGAAGAEPTGSTAGNENGRPAPCSASRIRFAGLPEAKPALGENWHKARDRAYALAEGVLARHLGPDDHVARDSNGDFVIRFGSLSEHEAAAKARQIGREIRETVLTDSAGDLPEAQQLSRVLNPDTFDVVSDTDEIELTRSGSQSDDYELAVLVEGHLDRASPFDPDKTANADAKARLLYPPDGQDRITAIVSGAGSGDAADDEGEEHAAPARKITRALARRTGDATRGG